MKKILLITGILLQIAVSLSGTQSTATGNPETFFSRQASIYKAMNRDGFNPGDRNRMKKEWIKIKSEKKYAEVRGAFLPGEKQFLRKEYNRFNRRPAGLKRG